LHTIRDELEDLEQRIDDLTSFHTGTEFQDDCLPLSHQIRSGSYIAVADIVVGADRTITEVAVGDQSPQSDLIRAISGSLGG